MRSRLRLYFIMLLLYCRPIIIDTAFSEVSDYFGLFGLSGLSVQTSRGTNRFDIFPEGTFSETSEKFKNWTATPPTRQHCVRDERSNGDIMAELGKTCAGRLELSNFLELIQNHISSEML